MSAGSHFLAKMLNFVILHQKRSPAATGQDINFPPGKVNILAGGGRGALLGQNDKI